MTDETKTVDTPAAAAPIPNAVETSGSSTIPAEELGRITDDIVGALKTVYDPEIPADIYELGLIYKVDIADDRAVTVDMTLTTPNCPGRRAAPRMPAPSPIRCGRPSITRSTTSTRRPSTRRAPRSCGW
jgi:hypothetical protein